MSKSKGSIDDVVGTICILLLAFCGFLIEKIEENWIMLLAIVLLAVVIKISLSIKKKIDAKNYQEYLEQQEFLRKHEILESHNKLIQTHKKTLIKKYKQLTYIDDYGNFKQNAFNKELDYFIRNVLFKGDYPTKDEYDYEFNRILLIIENEIEENPQIEVSDNPYDFEKQCAEILNNNGWLAETTPKSADQGIDVVATKSGKTIALQCKLYSKPVGNKAVQEAYSGKQYYEADFAGVVSNNTYTPSAKQLAKNCNVYLLSLEDLSDLDEILKIY